MFRFFSKMRYKLAAENRVAKYLRYAIGEILLVVIGILLALQINNWNQQQKENKAEQNALVNLKEDFVYNRNLINTCIWEADSIMRENVIILDHTGNKFHPKSGFDLDSVLNSLAYTPKYYPKNGFLDDLLNSGNLGIFKSVELRKLLSSWNPTLADLKERELNCYDLNTKIEDYITERGSWLNLDFKYGTMGFPVQPSGFEVNNNVFLTDLKFENYVENHIYYMNALKTRQKNILKLSDQIIFLIDKNIKE